MGTIGAARALGAGVGRSEVRLSTDGAARSGGAHGSPMSEALGPDTFRGGGNGHVWGQAAHCVEDGQGGDPKIGEGGGAGEGDNHCGSTLAFSAGGGGNPVQRLH